MKNLLKCILGMALFNCVFEARADVKCWVVGYPKKEEGSFSQLIQATSKQDAINFFKKNNPGIKKIEIDGDCNANIPDQWIDRNMPDSARTPNSLKAESSKVSSKNAVTERNETQSNQSNSKNTNSKTAQEQAADALVESMEKNGLFEAQIDTNDPASMLRLLEPLSKVLDETCDKVLGPKQRQELIAKNKSRNWQVQAIGVAPYVVTSVRQGTRDSCTGAAQFSIEYKRGRDISTSTLSMKCGFNEVNSISMTTLKAQCF